MAPVAVETGSSRSTISTSVTEGHAMNPLEAAVVHLLAGGRQEMEWARMPGAGRRAAMRLILAIVLIGIGVAALDIAS